MSFWEYLKIPSRKAGKNLTALGLGLVSSVPREAPVRAMTGFMASLVKASSFPCSFCPATMVHLPFWTCWSDYSGRAFALAVSPSGRPFLNTQMAYFLISFRVSLKSHLFSQCPSLTRDLNIYIPSPYRPNVCLLSLFYFPLRIYYYLICYIFFLFTPLRHLLY